MSHVPCHIDFARCLIWAFFYLSLSAFVFELLDMLEQGMIF